MGFFDIMHEPPVPYGEPYPKWTRISIETCSRCTRACWFCPTSERAVHAYMSDRVYHRIIDQLSGFKGVVQWFFLNEPLLDPQHESRLKSLRSIAPKCTIHLTTNWDVMWHSTPFDWQVAKIQRLFDAGVNSLNLNDYSKRGYKRLLSGVENCTVGEHNWKRIGSRARHLSITEGSPERKHSWGGYCDGNAGGKGYCARPHRHIVVNAYGDVILCCAVGLQHEVLGSYDDLEAAWNSKRMFEYRWFLQNKVRQGDCAQCDERMAFPHVVRKVEVPWRANSPSASQKN